MEQTRAEMEQRKDAHSFSKDILKRVNVFDLILMVLDMHPWCLLLPKKCCIKTELH